MMYADIVHGVKGFAYYKWGAAHDDPGAETGMRHDYRLMSAIRQLNWEISDLSDAILAGTPVQVAGGSGCGKEIGFWCRESAGRRYLWVINHSNLPQFASAVLPGLKASESAEVFYEDRQATIKPGGELSEEFAPYAVHIYVWPAAG